MKAFTEYNENDNFIFVFENGKGVKIPATAYETKTNRRKLTGAFSDVSPIVAIIFEHEPLDLLIENSVGKGILISSKLIPKKTTRSAAGVTLFNLKKGVKITGVRYGDSLDKALLARCRKIKIPATGSSISSSTEDQLKIE